jgi:hypothetical protein
MQNYIPDPTKIPPHIELDFFDNIETVESTNAQQILSCSVSLTRKLILITTHSGFLIIYVHKPTKFKRYLVSKTGSKTKNLPFSLMRSKSAV